MVRIYKNLHDRSERQAGVPLFARSISIRRTSEAPLIYTPEQVDFFYGNFATLRYLTQITFNLNLLEHAAKFWFLFCRIKRGKTSSVSNKHKIIAQYSYDINTLREISYGLSSNRQTGNFA